jgi:hypothetical protein
MTPQENLKLYVKNIWSLIPVVGTSFVFSGIGLFIYQIYFWLKNGEWTEYSLLWPLSYIENLQSWVYYPIEWVGVHKILDFIPFPIFLVAMGVVIAVGSENKIN